MRRVAPLTVLLFLAAVLACVPQAAAKQVVLTPTWRPVAGANLSRDAVAASDRYLAIFDAFDNRLTLVDEQAHMRKLLVAPSCQPPPSYNPDAHGFPSSGFMFGGPWLLAGCGRYDLSTGRWTSFQLSSQCPGNCTVVGIGRYWVKIDSGPSGPGYDDPHVFLLQNLSTGALMNDPASPGGTTYDDLNAPSGSSRLCAPLRYPTADSGRGTTIGSVSFYGPVSRQFALLTGTDAASEAPTNDLGRCHSSLNLSLTSSEYGSPIASSSAVVVPSRYGVTVSGWLLPGLQQFTLKPNRGPNSPLALTNRALYLESGEGNRLWWSPLPTASQLRACVQYRRRPRRHSRARARRTNPCL
jgi:hypothetical protein